MNKLFPARGLTSAVAFGVARLITAGALLTTCSLAMAQYVWVDDKGVKQFSDQPPPPGTPAKRILKAPGAARISLDSAPDAAAATPAAPEAEKKGPPTLAEREADFRKRRAEQEKAEKKATEDAKRKADNDDSCEEARRHLAAIDSGIRMATLEKNGERSIMDDQQRAQERAKTARFLDGCH